MFLVVSSKRYLLRAGIKASFIAKESFTNNIRMTNPSWLKLLRVDRLAMAVLAEQLGACLDIWIIKLLIAILWKAISKTSSMTAAML